MTLSQTPLGEYYCVKGRPPGKNCHTDEVFIDVYKPFTVTCRHVLLSKTELGVILLLIM